MSGREADSVQCNLQNMLPLISVIVTCYNQEKFIQNAVESVLSQSWSALECIIVDDGSTDGSREVIQTLKNADSRVRVVLQDNQGVSAARNAGFEVASGDMIQFLDGDDLLKTEKLSVHVQKISDDPLCSVSFVDHDFLDMRTGHLSYFGTTRIDPEPLQQMLTQWFDGVSLPIHAGLFRRSIWAENEKPFPVDYEGRCEDWIFLVIVALRGAKFCGIPQVLCTYRVGVSGFTDSPLNWHVASLHAALYINGKLDPVWQQIFLDSVFTRTLERYVKLKRSEILHSSWNWRLGNFLTSPIFFGIKLLRRLIKKFKRQGSR
ncbi:MAG: glycosyltransferase family 2 protein [Planctomycetia bacterium]